MVDYVDVPDSSEIKESEITISKARETLSAVRELNHVEFIRCCKASDGSEFIVFKTRVQLPQFILHGILPEEVIAVGFDPNDEKVPEVFALRADFPSNLPHTNMREFENPKSLCLYELAYNEVKLSFTAKLFIERIRNWLKNAALGRLHQDDQYLEPFLFDEDGTIIISAATLSHPFVNVQAIGKLKDKPLYQTQAGDQNECEYIFWPLRGKAGYKISLRSTPRELFSLSSFLNNVGVHFEYELIKSLRFLKDKNLLKNKLIVGVILEKNNLGIKGDPEFDCYAISPENSVLEIGSQLGLWDEFNGNIADILDFKVDDSFIERLKSIKIKTFKTQFAFNKTIAKIFNKEGLEKKDNQIVAIGMGALGSQVFINLTRQGYGLWALIDDDVLLPHNLARHALTTKDIGKYKSIAASACANEILGASSFSTASIINVLDSRNEKELIEMVRKADVLLDFSASVAVARHIANIAHKKKRIISCFLNPKGSDLVILAEDEKQNINIDYLEMVYYRGLITNPQLSKHLAPAIEKKYYAQSCRDLSFRISQDNVAIHAGIASSALKHILDSKEQFIAIWQIDPSDFTISSTKIESSKINYAKSNNWKIYYDNIFLDKIFQERKMKLPNETGGILIGSYDTLSRKIYIVDSIPSPPDSGEYPTGYQRGNSGLDEQLDSIEEKTAGNLRYIGEWHSHPEECSTNPSSDDKLNFAWIRNVLKNEGLPPLSLIIGDNKKHSLFVETMN